MIFALVVLALVLLVAGIWWHREGWVAVGVCIGMAALVLVCVDTGWGAAP